MQSVLQENYLVLSQEGILVTVNYKFIYLMYLRLCAYFEDVTQIARLPRHQGRLIKSLAEVRRILFSEILNYQNNVIDYTQKSISRFP